MPAKSKEQFKKMFVLEKEGKISDATRREFTDTADYKSLPEHSNPLHGKRRKRNK